MNGDQVSENLKIESNPARGNDVRLFPLMMREDPPPPHVMVPIGIVSVLTGSLIGKTNNVKNAAFASGRLFHRLMTISISMVRRTQCVLIPFCIHIPDDNNTLRAYTLLRLREAILLITESGQNDLFPIVHLSLSLFYTHIYDVTI